MRNVHLYRRQQDPTTVTPRAAEHKGIRQRFSGRPCVVGRSVASPVERRAAIILGAASGVHVAEAAAGPRPGPVHGLTAFHPVEPGPGQVSIRTTASPAVAAAEKNRASSS